MSASDRRGVPQADGSMRPSRRSTSRTSAEPSLYMAALPLDANVHFMTVMATKMPFIGAGRCSLRTVEVRKAIVCVALMFVALAGAAGSAWARSLEVGVDDDGVLLGSGPQGRRRRRRMAAGGRRHRAGAGLLGTVWRRRRARFRRHAAGLRAGQPRQPRLSLRSDRRRGRSPRRRRHQADPHARRPAAAVGVGNPQPRQPALPAQRAGLRGLRRAVAQRYGARVDRYILWNEPNLPLWSSPRPSAATGGARPPPPTPTGRWSTQPTRASTPPTRSPPCSSARSPPPAATSRAPTPTRGR